MPLGMHVPEYLGRTFGVNAREWILVSDSTASFEFRAIVLPPDAGEGAGPLPVPGCPLTAPSPACAVEADPLVIGETDWIFAIAPFASDGGTLFRPAMMGPLGEIVALFPHDYRWNPADVRQPVVGPGSRLAWLLNESELGAASRLRPVVWPTAGTEFADLPQGGFAQGPAPLGVDADGRIAGAGIDPELPVVWLPSNGDYTLVALPLLAGGKRGAALGVDDDLVVGWSDDGSAEHAVLWLRRAEGYEVRALPLPESAVACTRAVAISSTRIVGACAAEGDAPLAVLWEAGADTGSRDVVRLLQPLPGDAVARVVAVSGDLAVGTSAKTSQSRPQQAGWRLPPLAVD